MSENSAISLFSAKEKSFLLYSFQATNAKNTKMLEKANVKMVPS